MVVWGSFDMNEKIDISIVIPAYNESLRLPRFLANLIPYCEKSGKKYEIIVVDDGSIDGTSEAARRCTNAFRNLEVVRLENNRGKGCAVKTGFVRSKGDICLFMDADGSVQPQEIEKNIPYILEQGYDLFVGSRVLRAEDRILKAKWYRRLMGAIFNFLVHSLLFDEIADTQCGFKIFKREVIQPLFSGLHLNGFGFDIEILYLAHKLNLKIKEGPVSWSSVDGSKINLLTDSVGMFFNILQIRAWYRVF